MMRFRMDFMALTLDIALSGLHLDLKMDGVLLRIYGIPNKTQVG